MIVNHSVFPVLSSDVKAFVSDYFLFEFSSETSGSFNFKVPPTGFPTMLFCLGNKVNFFQHKHLTNESIIVGQLSKHVNLHPVNGTKIFGVNFKPYGFYNLLGISIKQLQDSAVESVSVFPMNEIAAIESRLQLSGDPGKVITQIEKMLLDQKRYVKKNDFLDGIVDEIVSKNGLLDPFQPIEGKVSVRTFQRYFSEVIGINPKQFCQALRHRFILQLMYANPGLKWNEMVLGGYYYDYSHFQKDFIKFTDVKPVEYLDYKNPFAGNLLEQEFL